MIGKKKLLDGKNKLGLLDSNVDLYSLSRTHTLRTPPPRAYALCVPRRLVGCVSIYFFLVDYQGYTWIEGGEKMWNGNEGENVSHSVGRDK